MYTYIAVYRPLSQQFRYQIYKKSSKKIINSEFAKKEIELIDFQLLELGFCF